MKDLAATSSGDDENAQPFAGKGRKLGGSTPGRSRLVPKESGDPSEDDGDDDSSDSELSRSSSSDEEDDDDDDSDYTNDSASDDE